MSCLQGYIAPVTRGKRLALFDKCAGWAVQELLSSLAPVEVSLKMLTNSF